jgi:hypothetical protein
MGVNRNTNESTVVGLPTKPSQGIAVRVQVEAAEGLVKQLDSQTSNLRCLTTARYNSKISNAYGIPKPARQVLSVSKLRKLRKLRENHSDADDEWEAYDSVIWHLT